VKTKVVGIRFDDELLPQARAVAKSQYLTLTSFVNRVVADAVKQNFLKENF
jgi:antitoxin component of RelBE/YafQ-DinJ toxin-antitoxin module